MDLAQALGIRPGITAVIGSGGKTTLLRRLAATLPGTVLLTTSTHIFPFPDIPLLEAPQKQALQVAFRDYRVLCAGVPEAGKLTGLPYDLSGIADYVLVEADGSHRLPLKAHESWEPVIPPETGRTVLVAGLSGLLQPISQVCHRPGRFAQLCGAALTDPATPQRVAAVLNREALGDVALLTQTEHRQAEAAALAALLKTPTVWEQKGEIVCW